MNKSDRRVLCNLMKTHAVACMIKHAYRAESFLPQQMHLYASKKQAAEICL